MSTERTKIISIRLEREIVEYYRNKDMRKLMEGIYKERGLNEISFMYDIEREDLIQGIRDLLSSGEIEVREGKLRIPKREISVDEYIDRMAIKDKDRLREKIIDSLGKQQDDIGNGGGL